MKAKNVFTLYLLIINTVAFAQSNNEIKLGYGLASGTEFSVSLGNSLGTAIGAAAAVKVGDVVSILINGVPTNVNVTKVETNTKTSGTFFFNYNHFLSKRFSWGIQGNYNPMKIENVIFYDNGTSNTTSDRYEFVSAYLRIDFHYVLKPKFQMYSGAMAGGIIDLKDTDDGVQFAAHFNLMGFRFGQQHAFFTELGIGLGPVLSLGYSARF